MVRYNFDQAINRRGTNSLKWDAHDQILESGMADRFDDESIPLFLADMDFACPEPVVEAMHQVVDRRIFGYTTQDCDPTYYQAISGWFSRRYGWTVDKEDVIFVNGTVPAVKYAIRAFSPPGGGIIIQQPVYGPFHASIVEAGRKVVDNRLIYKDGSYTMNFDLLEEQAADPNNTLMILCNPHNPVGRVWTAEELSRLADICTRNGVTVVADEIHGDIVRKGQVFHPLAKIAPKAPVMTCTAINKTFNLAGLHCTNVIIKDEALRTLYEKTLTEYIGHTQPTPFAIEALKAAYTQCDEWLEQLNAYVDGNIDWLLGFLKAEMPWVRCTRPEGTYAMWLDFSDCILPLDDIRHRIYNKANIILENGSFFDPNDSRYFERVCVPAPRALLEEAFRRIAWAFSDMPGTVTGLRP